MLNSEFSCQLIWLSVYVVLVLVSMCGFLVFFNISNINSTRIIGECI